MTPLRPSRRRAEAFADAVDGRTPDGPADPLLRVVDVLRDRPPLQARDEFAEELRARLLLEAETVLTPRAAVLTLPPSTRGSRERRLTAAAAALVLVGGTAGMAAAAQQALPGEALYPVKRGLEAAEAGLNLSDSGRGRDLLDQAAGRLAEAGDLVQAGPGDALETQRVTGTLEEFTRSAQDGAALLFDSYRETREPEDIAAVRTFVADGMLGLESLTSSAPPQSQDALAAGAVVLRDLDLAAQELCPGCSDLPDLELSAAMLARMEVSQALLRTVGWTATNDHPVVVERAWLAREQGAARSAPVQGAPRNDDGGSPREDAGDVEPLPGADDGPDPEVKPDAWPSIVPDLGDLGLPGGSGGAGGGASEGGSSGGGQDSSGGGSDSGSKKKPGGVVGEVTEPLGDAVETLLPDPSGDGLLP